MGPSAEEMIAEVAAQLCRAGCPEAHADAVSLVNAATGGRPAPGVGQDEALAPDVVARVRTLASRRARREPLPYILGTISFRGLALHVDRRVHIPRDDRSGLLVDAALGLPLHSRVHDIGTGCGAIALAIKSERPDLKVSGSDLSADAVAVAESNAERVGVDVSFLRAAGFPPGGRYDLVVACLPYAPEPTLEATHPPESTKYQPRVAFVAGSDGLAVIRQLIAEAPADQMLALEHAPDHAAAVRELLDRPTTVTDPADLQRVTIGVPERS